MAILPWQRKYTGPSNPSRKSDHVDRSTLRAGQNGGVLKIHACVNRNDIKPRGNRR
jgi:hypothetical protein